MATIQPSKPDLGEFFSSLLAAVFLSSAYRRRNSLAIVLQFLDVAPHLLERYLRQAKKAAITVACDACLVAVQRSQMPTLI